MDQVELYFLYAEYLFKCMMHERFMCQVPFSMDQIQLITEFLRLPDGMICYMRLHEMMISSKSSLREY